jgi:hypothetical protein
MRGTTPTHEFAIPVPVDMIAAIELNYEQAGKLVITKKELNDFTLSGQSVAVKLTQEETILFDSEEIVEIQMRLLTTTGEALVSDIEEVLPKRLLGAGGVLNAV